MKKFKFNNSFQKHLLLQFRHVRIRFSRINGKPCLRHAVLHLKKLFSMYFLAIAQNLSGFFSPWNDNGRRMYIFAIVYLYICTYSSPYINICVCMHARVVHTYPTIINNRNLANANQFFEFLMSKLNTVID